MLGRKAAKHLPNRSSPSVVGVARALIANLKKEKNFTIQFIPCTKERYFELLKNLKEIARAPCEVANHCELGYAIAFWAVPKLDEE